MHMASRDLNRYLRLSIMIMTDERVYNKSPDGI
jgi:hypothetical protein